MIANIMYEYENRLSSYRLIAEACLTGDPAHAGPVPQDPVPANSTRDRPREPSPPG